jgi:uncharacterized protein YuzE
MTVTIGDLTFDNVFYDEPADVLYLHQGEPATAVDFDASPEGHALRFGPEGNLVGITILNAKWLIEHEGKVTVTVPQHLEAGAGALSEALAAA